MVAQSCKNPVVKSAIKYLVSALLDQGIPSNRVFTQIIFQLLSGCVLLALPDMRIDVSGQFDIRMPKERLGSELVYPGLVQDRGISVTELVGRYQVFDTMDSVHPVCLFVLHLFRNDLGQAGCNAVFFPAMT